MKKWFVTTLSLILVLSLFAGFAVAAEASGKKEAEKTEEAETEEVKAEDAEETEEAEEIEETEDKEEDYEGLDRIGEETEDGYKIKITNVTGSEIMGINIQNTEGDSWVWSDEMLPEGDHFEDGETALLCYAPAEGEDENSTYNFQIVFTDWTVGFLHVVSLSDIEGEAELHRAPNSLPYLVYPSAAAGEEISMQDLEQAAFEGELASGMWDSVLNKGSSSSSSSGSSSGGSSGGGSSSSGGSGESCVGAGAMLW